jgi:hypothetical protein
MSDGGWFDSEAIESERLDADREMSEAAEAARREHALIKAGKCRHRMGGQSRSVSNGHLCPTDLAASPVGSFKCGNCGKVLTPEEATAAGWNGGPKLPSWARM